MTLSNFISLSGIVVLFAVAWIFSSNRREINWHIAVWGVGLQMLFAWFLFVLPAGAKVFLVVNDLVVQVLSSATAGAKFLFGPLALSPGEVGEAGETSLGFILAFQALPTIIFFSALMSILYFFNIMPKIIAFFARIFTRLMKVSGAESLCAASNIFVGVESALTIKPFLKDMTKSELCTVLTAGMATVSSSVLAFYVFSLKDVFPNIAGHLVSASFLSAPAALAMSKVLLPETEVPKTLGESIKPHIEREDNVFEAVINGANAGMRLIVGIVALLIAVLGLVALFDQGLAFLKVSLSDILGVIFYPFTIILGIAPADAGVLSKIIGERLIVTELTAYRHLMEVMASGTLTNMRSAIIASYALCGFAHVASMAIFIGGVSAIAPEKTKVLAQIGFRSLAAATLACLLTGAVAGVFII